MPSILNDLIDLRKREKKKKKRVYLYKLQYSKKCQYPAFLYEPYKIYWTRKEELFYMQITMKYTPDQHSS